jgi:predicted lipoprotein with Yx(FWY)xxD motif
MIRSTSVGLLVATAMPLVALALTACGSGNGTTVSGTTSSGPSATVNVATEGNLGKVLVDAQGRTLYLFQKDAGTNSECTGACATAWPPLRDASMPTVGTGLTASKVGTTPRSDGKPQVTYNGHPLYLYQADQKPGDTKGEGITAFGGGWFVLSPAGNMVSGTGSNSGGGYGY